MATAGFQPAPGLPARYFPNYARGIDANPLTVAGGFSGVKEAAGASRICLNHEGYDKSQELVMEYQRNADLPRHRFESPPSMGDK